MGIIFDCVPIMLVLVLHYRNFREKKIFGELRMVAMERRNTEPGARSSETMMLDFAFK